jgi:hypothetical protein
MGPKVHPLSIVSLVAGVLSLPSCCIALGQISKAPQVYSGKLFCYIGLACGGLGFLMTVSFKFLGLGSEIVRRYRRF